MVMHKKKLGRPKTTTENVTFSIHAPRCIKRALTANARKLGISRNAYTRYILKLGLMHDEQKAAVNET